MKTITCSIVAALGIALLAGCGGGENPPGKARAKAKPPVVARRPAVPKVVLAPPAARPPAPPVREKKAEVRAEIRDLMAQIDRELER